MHYRRHLVGSFVLSAVISALFSGVSYGGTTNYYYDAQGRLLGDTNAYSSRINQFRWDNADNRTSIAQGWIIPPSSPNTLGPGQGLVRGQHISSTDNQYSLSMESDGNLVVWGPSNLLWQVYAYSSNTFYVAMTQSGTLTLYDTLDNVIWQSPTSTPGSYATIQTNGNLVIFSPSGTALWSTGT